MLSTSPPSSTALWQKGAQQCTLQAETEALRMKYFGEGLSELHTQLNSCIRKEAKLEEAKALFLQLHAAVHLSAMSGGSTNEVDALFCDLERSEYAVMPTVKDETIAWALWHLARIEDLTMGVLAGRGDQLFDHKWKIRLNAPITDTGNALTDDEIMQLSKSLDTAELLHYRNEVGRRTRAMVQKLTTADLRQPVDPTLLEKIRSEGGVTQQSDSAWLLDFWAKKDVAGLLLMPPTRHAILHLNDCCKWKEQIRTRRQFYRR